MSDICKFDLTEQGEVEKVNYKIMYVALAGECYSEIKTHLGFSRKRVYLLVWSLILKYFSLFPDSELFFSYLFISTFIVMFYFYYDKFNDILN